MSLQGKLYLLCTENDLKLGDFVITYYEILLDRTLKGTYLDSKGDFLLNKVLQHVESLTHSAASGDYELISPRMLIHKRLCTEDIYNHLCSVCRIYV